MFFPIGDDNVKGGSKPMLSYSLIGLNLLVYLYEASLPPEHGKHFVFSLGAIPFEILSGQDLHTLISSMFLHGGWVHLLGNMLFLWVFADNIEAVIGTFNFFMFYLIGGVVAAMAHIFFNPFSEIPMVGASGAISAVMGAYLVMFPASRIRVLVLIFFRSVFIPAFLFLGIWIIQQLISGFGSLGFGTEESGGVAWWAHIGGFAFGVLAGFVARSQYKNRYRYQRGNELV